MDFISGIELSKSFFFEIVKPLIQKNYPELLYASGLIGTGSEVQGFDDITSTDHHWGVRILLFLEENDFESVKSELNIFFRQNLPYEFKGHSTHWSSPDPNDNNNQFPIPISKGEINHRIEIYTVSGFLEDSLGIQNTNLSEIDWLLLSEQRLREFTGGEVFEDLFGSLTRAREALTYFPPNVWLYKIASQWNKIAEEIAFPGRIGMQKDVLGGQIESSRLIRYVMVLGFILEKQYVPYPKWFGTAFSKLKIAQSITPLLIQALNEIEFNKRDKLLCKSYLKLVEVQNSLGIIEPLELSAQPFFSRPISVIDVGKIVNSLKKRIKTPLDKIKYLLGSIDQMIDYPNLLSNADYFKKLRIVYEEQ